MNNKNRTAQNHMCVSQCYHLVQDKLYLCKTHRNTDHTFDLQDWSAFRNIKISEIKHHHHDFHVYNLWCIATLMSCLKGSNPAVDCS